MISSGIVLFFFIQGLRSEQIAFQDPTPVSAEIQACSNKVLRAYSGNISDGPGNYGLTWHCTWTIAPKNATSVELIVTALALQGADGESFPGDVLQIWECNDETCGAKFMILELTSFLLFDTKVVSTTGVMMLEFWSDGTRSFSGFEAQYKSPCPPGSHGPSEPDCVPCRTNCLEGKSLVGGRCGPSGAILDNACKCQPGEIDSDIDSACVPCPQPCSEGVAPICHAITLDILYS